MQLRGRAAMWYWAGRSKPLTGSPETVKLIKERGINAYPELLPIDKREIANIDDLDMRRSSPHPQRRYSAANYVLECTHNLLFLFPKLLELREVSGLQALSNCA